MVVSSLFFLGLVVFVAATLLFFVRLYRHSLGWGLAATFMPPAGLVPLLAYLRKHALAGVLMMVGAYAALVSGVLWLRMHPESGVVNSQSALMRWLAPAALVGARYISAFPDVVTPDPGKLEGRFNGADVSWMRVEWSDNVLRFATRSNPLEGASLQIRLPDGWNRERTSPVVEIAPTQADAPAIEMVSLDPAAQHPPTVTVIKGGYWLTIEVTEAHDSVLKGRIHLVLPSPYQTWVSGDFVAHPEGIRYVNGEFDRRYDSPQTLARIGASHVNSFLWRWMEGTPQLSRIRLQTGYEPQGGQALARVNLGAMGTFDLPLEFRKGESGWYVIPDAVPMITASLEMQAAPPAAGKLASTGTTIERPADVREVNQFSRLRRLDGQKGELHTLDGRRLTGTLVVAEDNRIRLLREVSGNQLALIISEGNFLKFVPQRNGSSG